MPFVGKLDEVPEGWKILDGSIAAPRGYTFVCNGESRFANPSKYKNALVPLEAAKRYRERSEKC